MKYHLCRYFLDGRISLSAEEFILANQKKFGSIDEAWESLNIAKLHIWLLEAQNLKSFEHSNDNKETYLVISLSKTKWYYVFEEGYYHFYKILNY